jgi:hypothetical protein
MNASFAPPQSPRGEASRPAERSRRVDSSEQRRGGDDFERLLRDKAAARDDGDSPDDPNTPSTPREPDAGGLARFLPPAPAPSMAPTAFASPTSLAMMAASAPQSAAADTAPHAALEAALNADPGSQPLSGTQADTAGAWQVSLNEPMGVAVELRATRPASGGAAGEPAAWTLTIASSSTDAAMLTRHAPRLNERLRARALTRDHVRIEGDDEAAS